MDADISKHICLTTVADEKELKEVVDSIVAQELPADMPFWCVHRIENLSGLSCVLTRIHHVIGDGISLVAAINKVFCDENDNPLVLDLPVQSTGARSVPLISKIVKMLSAIGKVLYVGISPYDSDISFTSKDKPNLKMTSTRKSVFFPTVKLEFLKKLKNAAGCTLNDILLSATSGAIRKYSEYRGDDLSSKRIHNRALVPLAFFRPIKDLQSPHRAMSNKFAFLSVDLPMKSRNAADRVKECNVTMNALKTSPVALVQLWVQSYVLSLLPLSIQRKLAHDAFSRHTMVFSNVPGPSKVITLGGEPVVGMQVIFPNLLPQVILISYSGSVFMNMVLDDALVTDFEKLCDFYLEELKELAKKYGIEDSDLVVLAPKSPGGEFETIDV